MAEEFRVLRPYEYHSQLVAENTRADGRRLDEFRDLKLETDAIRTADASSLVKLGNTSLVCGCIAERVKLKDNISDLEEVKIRIELPPVCSSPYGNRTQNTAQLLTRTLKGILDEMNCLDRTSLHNPNDDEYWSVDVEIVCLNYDGSLLDASLIAVLATLKTLRLPFGETKSTSRLVKFDTIPTTCSFAMISDKIICDPNLEEETISQSTFSITIDSRPERGINIHKIGGKPLSEVQLRKCIELSSQRAQLVQSILGRLIPKDDKMDTT